MENNLTNKARFFALYWGQNVVWNPVFWKKPEDVVFNNDVLERKHLELKSLSQITDEDAIEVAEIVSPEMFMSSGKDGKHFIDRRFLPDWITVRHSRKIMSVDIDLDGYTLVCNEEEEYLRNPHAHSAIDYLRSKGYALPFLGISVETLIEHGWIKLKTK